MHEASNGREEKKSIAIYSMGIKRRLCKHRGDCRSCEKIDKEISIPCDKIREKSEKMLSPLMKSTDHNT